MSEERTQITPAELKALPPEEQEKIIIRTQAQMILDLIDAARLPRTPRLLGALYIVLEALAVEMEEEVEKLAAAAPKDKEIYLASNLKDALRGGSAKAIFKG